MVVKSNDPYASDDYAETIDGVYWNTVTPQFYKDVCKHGRTFEPSRIRYLTTDGDTIEETEEMFENMEKFTFFQSPRFIPEKNVKIFQGRYAPWVKNKGIEGIAVKKEPWEHNHEIITNEHIISLGDDDYFKAADDFILFPRMFDEFSVIYYDGNHDYIRETEDMYKDMLNWLYDKSHYYKSMEEREYRHAPLVLS